MKRLKGAYGFWAKKIFHNQNVSTLMRLSHVSFFHRLLHRTLLKNLLFCSFFLIKKGLSEKLFIVVRFEKKLHFPSWPGFWSEKSI
jgi:hypothetical protein